MNRALWQKCEMRVWTWGNGVARKTFMAQDRGRVTPTSAISAITLSPEDTPNAEPRGLDPLATPPPPSPRQEARSIGSGTRASLESALESRSERLLALAMEGLGTPSL